MSVRSYYSGDLLAACVVRALYPQLAGTMELFPDLNYAVAVVLLLVGADMVGFGNNTSSGCIWLL
jgi:tellurite resistance protein TerC